MQNPIPNFMKNNYKIIFTQKINEDLEKKKYILNYKNTEDKIQKEEKNKEKKQKSKEQQIPKNSNILQKVININKNPKTKEENFQKIEEESQNPKKNENQNRKFAKNSKKNFQTNTSNQKLQKNNLKHIL